MKRTKKTTIHKTSARPETWPAIETGMGIREDRIREDMSLMEKAEAMREALATYWEVRTIRNPARTVVGEIVFEVAEFGLALKDIPEGRDLLAVWEELSNVSTRLLIHHPIRRWRAAAWDYAKA